MNHSTVPQASNESYADLAMDTHLNREVTGQLLFVCLNGSLLCYFFCSSEAEQTLLFLCLHEVKKHTGTDFQIKTLSGHQLLLTLRTSGNRDSQSICPAPTLRQYTCDDKYPSHFLCLTTPHAVLPCGHKLFLFSICLYLEKTATFRLYPYTNFLHNIMHGSENFYS